MTDFAPDDFDASPSGFSAVLARTTTIQDAIEPLAFDCMKIILVRDGSAILLSEFGQRHVKPGDVILLGANTLCGSEPEGRITVTTIYADMDYIVDQVFWRYVGVLYDRLDAQDFVATTYTEPAQILRLGESCAEHLMPWMDELVALSTENRPVENFYQMQALWSSIVNVLGRVD